MVSISDVVDDISVCVFVEDLKESVTEVVSEISSFTVESPSVFEVDSVE